MFRNAIVCTPCASMIDGITSSDLGKPLYHAAMQQHSEYVRILQGAGLEVEVLPARTEFPDSTFLEDVALCTPFCAIITCPGAITRKGEISGIREVLSKYYGIIEEICPPGTLEGGDVMVAGNHYYIGISARTNDSGASQLINILKKYEMTGSKIPLKNMLHLKSGLSYLENNNILISGEFIENRNFENFNKIIVDDDESYAANSLWINGQILVPAGFPKTRSKIEKAGYKTIVADVSEFRKLDGGLSCLSLRF